jgi:uncharacterized protein (DUF2062 family)/SAM-dependent methyltransferase
MAMFGSAAIAGHMRRLVQELRTEAGGAGREATAIGVGVFIGSLPFFGFHLVMCLAAGWLLRLNRLKLYMAANISNPLMAPLLIFTEVQAGALARRGQLMPLTLDAVRQIDPWTFGGDLLLGSVIVGAALGVTLGGATWLLTRGSRGPAWFAGLADRASDRFAPVSITAWEFARAKLRSDPLYHTVLTSGALASGSLLVDVGCGSGLTLALLAESAEAHRERRWPRDVPPPPEFQRLVGIELRPRVARIAQRALGSAATILAGDAVRVAAGESCDAVLFFDVLQMIPYDEQERLLASMRDRLTRGGVMLVREADAAAGWRFAAVRAGNRLKALVVGRWRQRFYFRPVEEWKALFDRLDLAVVMRGAGDGTPFANVLFALRPKDSHPRL